jgi:hypothetical protein
MKQVRHPEHPGDLPRMMSPDPRRSQWGGATTDYTVQRVQPRKTTRPVQVYIIIQSISRAEPLTMVASLPLRCQGTVEYSERQGCCDLQKPRSPVQCQEPWQPTKEHIHQISPRLLPGKLVERAQGHPIPYDSWHGPEVLDHLS